MEGHGHLLSFDSDAPEFSRGFEAGRIWTLLRERPDEPVAEYAHAVNAEMLMRMAEATGRQFEAEDLGDDWLEVRFAPAIAEREELGA